MSAANSAITSSDRLRDALKLSSGARFYRCALQVNPYAYLKRHNKKTSFKDETEYNAAIVSACRELKIEVIGITDHYRVSESMNLARAAREAKIFVFTGFEAVTKDGVHFLSLFDDDKENELERIIGSCGIIDKSEASPIGTIDAREYLKRAKEWSSICIAAHVAAEGGLLKQLKGQSRIETWKSPELMACAIPGPLSDVPPEIRPILENKNKEHKLRRRMAIINASDVNCPEDLKKNGAACYIKMSNPSVEGLRQSFLDPESRIRLNSDPQPESHTEFIAISWEGGFLNGMSIHFNGNLNILVGGRGNGKSTVIESIRYTMGLEPLGREVNNDHQGIIKNVLKSGTKITLLVRSHGPSDRYYTIERTVPNPPIVKKEDGTVLKLTPKDIIPNIEVYGQHEISELTKSQDKLILLLKRFLDQDAISIEQKSNLQKELERSRNQISNIRQDLEAIDERLSLLPGLEETQKRFQEAGMEAQLKEKSLYVREEHIFSNIEERLEPVRALHNELMETIPLDCAFVAPKALRGLPNETIFNEIKNCVETLSFKLKQVVDQIEKGLAEADNSIAEIKCQWERKLKNVEQSYETLLRRLQKEKFNGEEYIRLRKRIEELRPLTEARERLKRDLDIQMSHRNKLLSEWENMKANEFKAYNKAAKKISRKLQNIVKVDVIKTGNRKPLEQLILSIKGMFKTTLERFQSIEDFSICDLANRCREGKDSLIKHYLLTDKSAEKISQAGEGFFMEIEELDLSVSTEIKFNITNNKNQTEWKNLNALSTGQKATAVLLLLLLESEAPLIIDQPEDDLDNRFISEGIVPIIRREKKRRQFIFSTHNANFPVLGDAELIIGLTATGDSKDGQAKINSNHMGSIDFKPVSELVKDILEGGENAFEIRRSKYGF